jgi:isomerase DpgB
MVIRRTTTANAEGLEMLLETSHSEDVVTGAPVRLLVDGGEPLSPDLVAAVEAAGDLVEDAGGRLPLLLVLGGGADQRDHEVAGGTELVNRWERVLRRVERLPAVTIGMVVGRCTGTAFELLLATDHRLAAVDACVRPPSRVDGIWPGTLLHRVTRQLGVAAARQLALFAPELTATRAAEIGLVDEVVDDPIARIATILPTLAGVPGTEWAIRRRLLFDATVSYEEMVGAHLSACDRALRYQ